jgi:hypothetical protein
VQKQAFHKKTMTDQAVRPWDAGVRLSDGAKSIAGSGAIRLRFHVHLSLHKCQLAPGAGIIDAGKLNQCLSWRRCTRSRVSKIQQHDWIYWLSTKWSIHN